MTKWEYWFAFGPLSCGELNNIGKDGWELTAVIESTQTRGRWMYYFKRPLLPEPITFDNVVSCTSSYTPVDIYAPPAVIAFAEVKEINEG